MTIPRIDGLPPGSAPFFTARAILHRARHSLPRCPRSVRRLLSLRGRFIGRGVVLRRSFAAGSNALLGLWPQPAVCRSDGLLGRGVDVLYRLRQTPQEQV